MFIQGIFLPIIYLIYKHLPVQSKRVIFADAHHDTLPFSMQIMHQNILDMGFEVIDYFYDYGKMNKIDQIHSMIKFMKLYTTAKYVFLCDYFLPVSSCKKKEETMVVQLWHCGGILKKMGIDALDDIPCYYKLNPHKNYNLMTVSAPNCIPVFTRCMNLSHGIVQSTGISRSDIYFDSCFNRKCKLNFFQQYPKAYGKKIVLWAPTFRGNASDPFLVGKEDILKLQKELGLEWVVLIKAHPYIDRQQLISNCKIPAEKLLPIIDVLITDYSTILFDYMLYEKPFVLFAPDFDEYQKQRGFYIDYNSLPGPVITKGNKLASAVKSVLENPDRTLLKKGHELYMENCDGNSTKRIISLILSS